ncbi:MAG: TldD/PmbA family protein [Candidatus Bipolaricaulia bacterium]
MKEKLAGIVCGLSADYADLRYEVNRKTRISYQGDRLVEVASYETSGGHVRAYASGGKAIASFSDPAHAGPMAEAVAASARIVGDKRDKPLRLADTTAIVESFPISSPRDVRSIPLQEKLDLVSHYNELILREPTVATTEANYDEFVSHRVFVNSEGSVIEYDIVVANILGFIVTKKGEVLQRVRFAYGGNEDFDRLRNREDDLEERIETARRLLDAEPAKAGLFPVLLDPSEAGVFIHEAFGHLSEADGLQNNPAFRAKLTLGTRLGSEILNVSDDPRPPGLPGSFQIDDEGVRAVRTPLITEGVLSGRMHSRETAAEFGEPLSGNMRAVDAHHTPIVRMSNISIEAGPHTFDEMVASIEDGYYLVGAKGGQTSGDQFTFGAQWGYKIEEGRLGAMVRDINMSGELFSTLQAISMIGSDIEFGERGGCGKGNPQQSNRQSGKGAPHIKIDRVTIGGV